MDGPLWIDTYQPSLDELPQPELRQYLERVTEGPINLLLHGPAGSGKTAAVHALADDLHAAPDTDLQVINVADFFGLTKREIADDPRFAQFIDSKRRRDSKASMINYVLKELAGYPPVSGDFKTILLDNAEAMRPDFQQSLRRVMERHYAATQFVITTRKPGTLIQPIRSRCAQIPVRSPSSDETVAVLESICDAEDVPADSDGLEYIAGYADGDLRRAIMAAQTTAVDAGEITMEAAYEALDDIGRREAYTELLAAAESGDVSDARSDLDDLLIDAGLDGDEILSGILSAARTRYDPDTVAQLTTLAGEIEFDLVQGINDRVHLTHFLAEVGASDVGA